MKRRLIHVQVVVFVVIGLTIFFSGISTSPFVEPIIRVFNTLIYPIMSVKNALVQRIEDTLDTYVFLVNVQKENRQLKEKIQELYLYEALYRECSLTVDKLGKDLRTDYSLRRYKTLRASIIGYDPTGRDNYVVINKGKQDGVKEGYIAVSGDVLLGIVGKVFQNTSKVYTVFNPKLKLSVVVSKTGKKYIYEGGWPLGRLLHVNIGDKVEKDFEIRLRDVKRRLPAFKVGRVERVNIGEDPFFKSVYIKPYVDVRGVEFTLLIKRSL